MTTTPVLGVGEIAENQDSSEVTANEAFRRLEQGSGMSKVISSTTTSPPASPADGDAYVLATGTPTGAWAGQEDAIAYYQSSSWEFITPQDGHVCYVTGTGIWLQYSESSPVGWNQVQGFVDLYDTPSSFTAHKGLKANSGGTALVETDLPNDLLERFEDVPGNDEVVARWPIVRGCVLPANGSGSVSKAGVAATGSTVFSIKQNGSEIGTITYAASGTTGTFATSSGTAKTLAVGDIITIVGPASADATIAQLSFGLQCYRNGTDS